MLMLINCPRDRMIMMMIIMVMGRAAGVEKF